MLEQEAIWFKKKLSKLDALKIGKMLNVGSSTYAFRSFYQPYIDKEIFLPLAARGVSTIHLDIKDDEGIDLVGNIEDNSFASFLKDQCFDTIFCSNFLEHVQNRSNITQILDGILTSKGLLILSVPHLYPYHRDPIDTLYRPDPDSLAASFPNFFVLEKEIIFDNLSLASMCLRRPKTFFKHIIYFCNIFSSDWIKYIKYVPFIFSRFQVTCLILEKK